VPYFLYCRSIELVLKAFLLVKGVPKKDLPKRNLYGHDLGKILEKAKELDLEKFVKITPEQEREISKANKYYASKGFEYFEVIRALKAYPELPDLQVLDQVASELVTYLESFCLNAD
jgi:SOS response regulatory protein OraA/RecX